MKFSWFTRLRESLAAPRQYRRMEVVADWPEIWADDTVFVQGEGTQYWSAAFVCPCGCHDIVYLNLLPNQRPRWKVTQSKAGYPTIKPSVARKVKCRAHFFIHDGRVVHCRWDDAFPTEQ